MLMPASHLFQLVQRFWIASPKVLAARGALRLRAHLRTVSDDRSKMLRIFQPLESLMYTMCLINYRPCSAALGPTLSSSLTTTSCFSTSSRRFNFSGSPSAMMSSPCSLKAVIDLVTYLECCISCFFENSLHVFRASLVSFATCIPLFLHHAAGTSQSARPLAAVHARTQR